MLQHAASPYIISIIQHYGNRKQSCCNMMHHPTSSPTSNVTSIRKHSGCNMIHHPTLSPSSNIIAIVSIDAATGCITLYHLHHPTLWTSHSIHAATWSIIIHNITQHYIYHTAFILQHDASHYIISIIKCYINNTTFMLQLDATWSITLHHLHHPTSSSLSNIISITQHSCSNVLHHPT